MPRRHPRDRARPPVPSGTRRGRHGQVRLHEHRQRIAHEAARLMADGNLADYRAAKLKAAQRLAIPGEAALPDDREVEQALIEYRRLFQPGAGEALRQQREAAAEAMAFLAAFQPRLAGMVLDGTADAHAAVVLHLHVDEAEAVARFLDLHMIPAESGSRRLRLDRQRAGDFPAWRFSADGVAFELVTLPADVLRQAPLGSDDRPMHRASLARLRALLAGGDDEPG